MYDSGSETECPQSDSDESTILIPTQTAVASQPVFQEESQFESYNTFESLDHLDSLLDLPSFNTQSNPSFSQSQPSSLFAQVVLNSNAVTSVQKPSFSKPIQPNRSISEIVRKIPRGVVDQMTLMRALDLNDMKVLLTRIGFAHSGKTKAVLSEKLLFAISKGRYSDVMKDVTVGSTSATTIVGSKPTLQAGATISRSLSLPIAPVQRTNTQSVPPTTAKSFVDASIMSDDCWQPVDPETAAILNAYDRTTSDTNHDKQSEDYKQQMSAISKLSQADLLLGTLQTTPDDWIPCTPDVQDILNEDDPQYVTQCLSKMLKDGKFGKFASIPLSRFSHTSKESDDSSSGRGLKTNTRIEVEVDVDSDRNTMDEMTEPQHSHVSDCEDDNEHKVMTRGAIRTGRKRRSNCTTDENVDKNISSGNKNISSIIDHMRSVVIPEWINHIHTQQQHQSLQSHSYQQRDIIHSRPQQSLSNGTHTATHKHTSHNYPTLTQQQSGNIIGHNNSLKRSQTMPTQSISSHVNISQQKLSPHSGHTPPVKLVTFHTQSLGLVLTKHISCDYTEYTIIQSKKVTLSSSVDPAISRILTVGDRLVSINGTSTVGMPFNTVIERIKCENRPILLGFTSA